MFIFWICFLMCMPAMLFGQELKLIHIVFSHKFYAPIQSNIDSKYNDLPKKLNYQLFLEQTYDMSNSAKMDMFNFGVFLRERYNEFLGNIYFPEIMRMRTSQYILSMISGQLVSAGLWPPAESQKWNNSLNWQPVVTDYVHANRDSLLLGTLCPNFLHEEERVYQHETTTSSIIALNSLFNYISQHYKSEVKRPSDVALLYSYFQTQIDYNKTLPTWTEKIFPNGDMMNATLLSYDLLSRTKLQKQLNGGTLLKAIINDTMLHRTNSNIKLKISMYSGEERNLIGILQSMGLWSPHILNPTESILFEVYENSTIDQYTIKMIYFTGIDNNTIALKLPDCEEFCPVDKFKKYLEDVTSIDDEYNLCQGNSIGDDKEHSSGISLSESFNYYLLLIILSSIILQ